ncbi:MAG: antibiotic ABC transporter ATP-binding protein [Flavobacteriaceae bacterium]|nr:MAG: antibiotic ABC transporter ATP-binding protein [Flavobacteriaceae bacterium]
MNHTQRILNFARPYRKNFILNLIFNWLFSLMSIFSVASIEPVLTIILNAKQTSKELAVKPVFTGEISNISQYFHAWLKYTISSFTEDYGAGKALLYFALFTIFTFFLRNVFRYISSYNLIELRVKTSMDIRNTFYQKILKLPVAYFSDQRKGDVMARISSDVGNVEGNILMSLVDLTRAPFMLFMSLAALFVYDVKLSLFSLILIPFMGGIISYFGSKLKKESHVSQELLGQTFSRVDETMTAYKIIKVFGAQNMLINQFQKLTDLWKNATIKLSRTSEIASPLSEFLGSVALVGVFWYGGAQMLKGNSFMTLASFMVYLGLFYQMLEPAKTLTRSFTNLKMGEASAERIFNILDLPEPFVDAPSAQEVKEFKNSIEFKNVSFGYSKDKPLLSDFNLNIKKGTTVALVGQSGSGKTTIANLLSRFYDVQKGEITLDSVNIKDLKIEQYSSLLGMVTQDSILFNDTVANNLRLAKPLATQQEMIEALKVANAWEFVEKLPLQLEENVGEAGGKLSGGQKQRLSIARAVLKNPPIMILDEATSDPK